MFRALANRAWGAVARWDNWSISALICDLRFLHQQALWLWSPDPGPGRRRIYRRKPRDWLCTRHVNIRNQ